MGQMEIPKYLRNRPIAPNGFLVPWFVKEADPIDFRVVTVQKFTEAINKNLCWVCGKPLGVHFTFVIGPMCMINRISTEPPSHLSCALYSVNTCPFLSRPQMKRSPRPLPADKQTAGFMIARNPGVSVLWHTRSYRIVMDHNQKPLIEVGEPDDLEFYREGRKATRDEINESIRTGLPLLEEQCENEEDRDILRRQTADALQLLPEK